MRTSSLIRTANRAYRSSKQRSALSTWRVERTTGEGSFDPITGNWIPPLTVTIYEGDAFLERQPVPRRESRDDSVFVTQSPYLRVPATAPRLEIGDICTPVDVRDNSTMNRSWAITAEPADSYGVHRNYPVEEVSPA